MKKQPDYVSDNSYSMFDVFKTLLLNSNNSSAIIRNNISYVKHGGMSKFINDFLPDKFLFTDLGSKLITDCHLRNKFFYNKQKYYEYRNLLYHIILEEKHWDTLLQNLFYVFPSTSLVDMTRLKKYIEEFSENLHIPIILINYFEENLKNNKWQMCILYLLLYSLFDHPGINANDYSCLYLLEKYKNYNLILSGKGKNEKTFYRHPILKLIENSFYQQNIYVIIGSSGSGKKTIAKTYYDEHQSEFDCFIDIEISNKINKSKKSGTYVMTPYNFMKYNLPEKNKYTIQNNIPAFIVISYWNGVETSPVFLKIKELSQYSKIILLTTNPNCSNFMSENSYNLDLHSDTFFSISKKVFREHYLRTDTYISDANLDKLLEKIDYHLFTSILLAKSFNKQTNFSLSKQLELPANKSFFSAQDIIRVSKNYGIHDWTDEMYKFMTLSVFLANTEISFYTLSYLAKDLFEDFQKTFNTCTESGLILKQNNKFYIPGHLQKIIIALSDVSLENKSIHKIFIKVILISMKLINGIKNEELDSIKEELPRIIQNIFIYFPYKEGYHTGEYIRLCNYLWKAECSELAIQYLESMKSKLENSPIKELYMNDLAEINILLGYVYNDYNSCSNNINSIKSLYAFSMRQFSYRYTNACNHFHKKEMSTNNFLDSKVTQIFEHNSELMAFVYEQSKEYFTDEENEYFRHLRYKILLQKLQYLICNLESKNSDDTLNKHIEDNISDCIKYFSIHIEDGKLKFALADSYFLRGVYHRFIGSDSLIIIDDLLNAKNYREEIAGKYHLSMIPIYLELLEIYISINDNENITNYLSILNNISLYNKHNKTKLFNNSQCVRIEKLLKMINMDEYISLCKEIYLCKETQDIVSFGIEL